MAAKKSFKKFDKNLVNKNNNIIKQNLKTIINPQVSDYQSNINYELLGIDQESKSQLIVKEQILLNTRKGIIKGLAEESRNLYEAREIIKNKKGDTTVFEEWFKELGYKKTYVYQSINIYEFFLETNSKQIFELPKSFVYNLYREKDEFEEAEIIEIIEDDKPKLKLKEIINKKEEERIENISGSNDLEKISDLLNLTKKQLTEKKMELIPIKQKYDDKKAEISELSKQVKELTQKIKFIKTN